VDTLRTLLDAAVIAGAAGLSISLWTLRVALAGRGRRSLASLIAGGEALLFVLIFTGLIANLGEPSRLIAYAVGVGGGTFVGLLTDEKLSRGQSEVRLIAPGDATAIVATLHGAGWPATGTLGVGPQGPATSVIVAVDDRRVDELLALVDTFEPAPFVTVERLRSVRPTVLPEGFAQVGDRRPARRLDRRAWGAHHVTGRAPARAGRR
jgi:uncharacterized protein YebE (UPF0316 family)